MNPVLSSALLLLGLPLASYLILFTLGEKLPRRGDWLAIAALAGSWVLSLRIFVHFWVANDPAYRIEQSWSWLQIGSVSIDFGILVDGMTAIMLVVVTTVSLLVHLFSSSYMAEYRRYARYFAFLGFFTFAMLGIVLTNSLFFLYCFWELVGIASYVLIGFFFERPAAARASKKAFIVNRVGDVGFWLGILFFFTAVGSFGYQELFAGVASGALSGPALTCAAILLFLGAVGKSAQVPLHVWLPDAMEGPTPVSALIHAATMVAAGVYMTARLLPLFSPDALLVVTYTGAITAVVAATIAIVQTDIKRGLAYSTLSQLGYMVMAVGVGSAAAGIFHLTTHAFFKACLFLGAGAVIHALHHEQDLRKMGGLRTKMPVTFAAMLVATIAISGVPPFAGFWSKDAVLGAALAFGWAHPAHYLPFVLTLIAAVLTGFYMFRILFLTFFGPLRPEHAQVREVDWRMTTPLVVLGLLAVIGGGFPGLGLDWFGRFMGEPAMAHVALMPGALIPGALMSGAVADLNAADPHGIEVLVGDVGAVGHTGVDHVAHHWAMILSLVAASLGILLSWLFYVRRRFSPAAVQAAFPRVHAWLVHKYYVDEFYRDRVVGPVLLVARVTAGLDRVVVDGVVNGVGHLTRFAGSAFGLIDRLVVDGLVHAIADLLRGVGGLVSSWQTGRVHNYLLGLTGGLVILILVYRTVWLS